MSITLDLLNALLDSLLKYYATINPQSVSLVKLTLSAILISLISLNVSVVRFWIQIYKKGIDVNNKFIDDTSMILRHLRGL